MARANNNSELWSHVSQFGYMPDSTSGLDTNLGSSVTSGTSTGISIASSGGSTDDYVRIGNDGNYEVAQVTANTSDSIDVKSALAFNHANSTTEKVKKVDRTDLGDISDDGIQWEVVADRTRIDAATQRHAYDHNINHTNYRVTVSLENLSDENWAVVMGIDEDNIHGAGTSSDPSVVDFTADDIDGIDPVHFWFQGALKNGDVVEIQCWDCRIDPSKTVTFARGQDAPAQIVFDAAHVRYLRPVS